MSTSSSRSVELHGGDSIPANGHDHSERWFRCIVESLPQLVWTATVDGRCDYANPRYLAYVGSVEREVTGDGWLNFVHPDDRGRAQQLWMGVCESGVETCTECRFRRYDGAYRWFDVRYVSLRDDDGRIVKWLASNTDIHESHETREALSAEKLRLSKMAAASPQMLHSVRVSPEGKVTFPYVSPSFSTLFGISPSELAQDGQPVLDAYHPDDQLKVRGSVEESARNMAPWQHEWRCLVPQRGEVWLEGYSMPVLDADGGITWHGSLVDVTARKRREEELRESELRLRQIAGSSNHVFWMTEGLSSGRKSYVSPAYERIWGGKPEVLLSNPEAWNEGIHPEDRPRVAEAFRRWLEAPLLCDYAEEFRVVHPSGVVRWVLDRGQTVLDQSGEIVRLFGVAEDITDRKAKEQEIRWLNAELEERVKLRTLELENANRELEAFSYSVSHDLRAPLRTVNGFSEALLEDFGDGLPAEERRYLQTIRDGARRMGQLIDDLLTFSRLSRQPLDRRTIDMQRLVMECLRELGHSTERGAAEVVVGELGTSAGDFALVRQVWSNLLSNAFKYSRNKSPAKVEIGCTAEESGAKAYFVRDNGTGFNMDYAHKLFRVFQRLHRDEEFEGTGVGLAIVHRVVTRHGGRIWAQARPGEGATFWFTLSAGPERLDG